MTNHPNKIITGLIIVLALLITATSCSNKETKADTTGLVKAKLQKTYFPSDGYYIRYIDPMYEPGDKLMIDAMDWTVISMNRPDLKDYQIKLHMDTVWLYDGDRYVGSYINTKWDSQMDSLILKDNL